MNIPALKWWCESSTSSIFHKIGNVTNTKAGRYSFIDRGSDVLAVAHLDTVFSKNKFSYKNGVAFSPALDDRLGAYVITSILPAMGINVDVLLTEGEESANSTAGFFEPSKMYNWIVSFDRMGTDVVMYEFKDEFMDELLHQFNFKPGLGSFSDISWLNDLGCKAFNIGVGYHQAHTKSCFARLVDTKKQLEKFEVMWRKMRNIHLEHDGWNIPANQSWWEDDEVTIIWDGHLLVCDSSEEEFVRAMVADFEYDARLGSDAIWEFYAGEVENV
jgi:hypothetical protein